MKRLAIICSSLALIAATGTDASAQTASINQLYKSNSVTTTQSKLAVASQHNSASLQKPNELNKQTGVKEVRSEEQKFLDDLEARKQSYKGLSNREKLDDINYVRQRMEELERTLYNKTKNDLSNKSKETKETQINKEEVTPVVKEALEKEYTERLLEKEVLEKIETETGLKQFGKEFFTNGQINEANIFAESAPSNYQLGPGDALKIIVWSEMGDETIYDVEVNPEGQVYVPIIGVLGVSGKTVGQFESMVMGKLSDKFKHFKGQVTLSKVRTIMVYVTGEVEKPGAKTVSGLTTAFSALYNAGGPTTKGSMRNIKVIDTTGKAKDIDLYKYFLTGDRKQDISIKNGDTIFVPPTEKHIKIYGMVARPAIYEVTGETSLSETIKMAGNILPEGFTGRISIVRWTGNERRKSFDVAPSDKAAMDSFKVIPGDEISIERSNGIIENSVVVSGPVHKPGKYSANNGLTISGLIIMAGGMIRETANFQHGQIVRKISGGKDEILSFDVTKAINGDKKHDLALKPLDEVKFFAEKEITNEILDVFIGGAVRTSGNYSFHEGMKLADLVLLANGLETNASGEVEIARKGQGNTSTIIKANINNALKNKDSKDNVTLHVLDKVNVIAKGDMLLEPEVVILKGQVERPGAYALTYRGEPLSSVIKRAGGMTKRAFPKGSVFMRNISNITSYDQLETATNVEKDLQRQVNISIRANLLKEGVKGEDVEAITQKSMGSDLTHQMMATSESDQIANPEIAEDNFAKALSKQNAKNKKKYDSSKDTETEEVEEEIKTRVAIPMEEILQGKLEYDVELMDGDEITVPSIPQTVSVLGAVMNPTTIMYNAKANAGYYINRAGGYNLHSDHRRTLVVKTNGEVIRLDRVSKVERGDIILVPPKGTIIRKDTLKEASSIATILGNLAVTYKVINDSKK